jgi:hypothetical protein
MTTVYAVGWTLAMLSLAAAAVFFWRKDRVAGICFVVVFIGLLGGVLEKRVVLTSAMLEIKLERDSAAPAMSK